jgi:hypothetical protein
LHVGAVEALDVVDELVIVEDPVGEVIEVLLKVLVEDPIGEEAEEVLLEVPVRVPIAEEVVLPLELPDGFRTGETEALLDVLPDVVELEVDTDGPAELVEVEEVVVEEEVVKVELVLDEPDVEPVEVLEDVVTAVEVVELDELVDNVGPDRTPLDNDKNRTSDCENKRVDSIMTC